MSEPERSEQVRGLRDKVQALKNAMERDKRSFLESVNSIWPILEQFVDDFFGHRCSDFLEGCERCRRWKALDTLLQDPWEDER